MRQLLILANVVILFLVIPAVSNAQDTLWAKTYGDENVNRANSIAPTVDGGFIIAGWQDTLGMGAENYFYVKTTADGDPVWSDWNGGDETDIAFSVEHTADYGYIFAGTSESFGRGICDFFIIKTNYWGTLQWSATYNSGQPSDGLCARSVQQTFDGGYIIAGRHSTGDPASHEQYLLKIGDYGVVGWENGYGHSPTEPITANHVSLTIDTCYIVAGTAPLNLLKVSADGDSLWSADLGMDEAMTVYPTADGGYIVVGNVSTSDIHDIILVKTDLNGNPEWTQTYGGNGDEYAYSVTPVPTGGYAIAGYTTSYGAGAEDVYVIRTNDSGDTIWTRTYGGRGSDEAHDIQLTYDGGLIVAGFTESFDDPNGDFWVLKIMEPVAVDPESDIVPVESALIGNYPNPFNSRTLIRYSIPEAGEINLTVYNIIGQKVYEVERRHNSSGDYSVTWDAEKEASGVYFVRLSDTTGTQTKRMVLMK